MKVIAYHGTKKNFDHFDLNAPKNGRRSDWRDSTVYFTDSLENAECYAAPVITDEAPVARPFQNTIRADRVKMAIRYQVRPGVWVQTEDLREGMKHRRAEGFAYVGVIDYADEDGHRFIHNSAAKTLKEAKRKTAASLASSPRGISLKNGLAADSQILKCELSFDNPMVVDLGGNLYYRQIGELVDKAKATGHDGLIVQNVMDAGGSYIFEPQTTYVVFSVEQIKIIDTI